jgi:hypothetical protein
VRRFFIARSSTTQMTPALRPGQPHPTQGLRIATGNKNAPANRGA